MQLADLDLNKLYSFADYYKWQFNERVELIKGEVFRMSPATTLRQASQVIYSRYLMYFLGESPAKHL